MDGLGEIHSGVFRPDPARCCERCAFGRGEHAGFCEHSVEQTIEAWLAAVRPHLFEHEF